MAIPLIAVALFISCKKDSSVNRGNVDFTVNGKAVSMAGYNSIQYSYTFGASAYYVLTSAYFSFLQNPDPSNTSMNELSFNLPANVYNPFAQLNTVDTSFNQSFQVDGFEGSFGGNSILTSSANFFITITRDSQGTMDGSFSGIVTGANGADTISNGIFKNVPITRGFD